MNPSHLPQKLLVSGHVTSMYGPVQALVQYLKERKASFSFISLPFSYTSLRGASVEEFHNGRRMRTTPGHSNRGPDPLLWIRDFLFNVKTGMAQGKDQAVSLFIGIDNLNAAAGILLRALGRVDKVAYYVIDYTPQRFHNPLLNALYHAVDRFCVRRADVIWNLSRRMQEVRHKQGASRTRNQVVPVGVALDEVRHPRRSQVKRMRLVYMGHITESKGVQLLVDAMPKILGKVPRAELHIIGTGPFEKKLKKRIHQSPARSAIFMPGPMNHAQLFTRMPRYGVALAPYMEEEGSFTYWADATKPKEYLACGLPLIITRVPWIWHKIASQKKPMGLAISYRENELVRACVKLLGDTRFYWRCRKNALAFAKDLDWGKIYDGAFKNLP